MDRTTRANLYIAVAGLLIVLASVLGAVLAPPAGPRSVPVDFTPETPPAGTIPAAAP
jgi:hypothetical protein